MITRRNVDIGDLIDGSGKPLFLLAQTDPLRVYVNVPQAYAQLVDGLCAAGTLHLYRGEARWAGVVADGAAIAGIKPLAQSWQELQQRWRTMLAALAELQAITSSLTPDSTRESITSSAAWRTWAIGFGPYGPCAVSPT